MKAATRATNGAWYAIRVSNQAARTASKRMVFRGPRNGSHEFLVPDVDDRLTIEVTLDELGVKHFVPFAYQDIEHKRRSRHWATKRVPLLPGWAFVTGVTDWRAIEEASGVIGVVQSLDGVKIPVHPKDMHDLRVVQWQCYVEYQRERENRLNPVKRRLREQFPKGSRHKFNHELLGEIELTVLSVTGRRTIKAIANRLGKIEVAVDELVEAA